MKRNSNIWFIVHHRGDGTLRHPGLAGSIFGQAEPLGKKWAGIYIIV